MMMTGGIESIAALAAGPSVAAMHDPGSSSSAPAPGIFLEMLQRELGEMNASVGAAEEAMRDLAAGKALELHDVMISLERARVSVQTFVHVRNKLVESYQDLLRMQL